MNFRQRVYALVRLIPSGRVLAYGDVATALGSPRAARQVGYALAALGDDTVPWHRVVRKSGHIAHGGEPGRAPLQRVLLEAEGVVFDAGHVDMARHRWQPEAGDVAGV